jgi:hypothetical protein
MKNQNRNIFLIAGLIILIAVMFYNSLSQPGISDLKSEFKAITSTRNEQNDGPILRAYMVTIDSLNIGDMNAYGNFMPHTKYGNTKVYFFYPNKPFPKKINLIEPVFDQTFEKYCLAVYEKNGMGQAVVRDF